MFCHVGKDGSTQGAAALQSFLWSHQRAISMWNISRVKHPYFHALMGPWMITLGLALVVAQAAMAGDCGCEAACDCEPACGMEATCGVEVDCGCEPACGLEEVGCGAESANCGCEPACGFEPDCGFEEPCGCESSGCDGGCDGGCRTKRFNPVYRSLDAVAGGIEKLFRLDKRRKSLGKCDNVQCDCASSTSDCGCYGGETMMIPTPMPSSTHHGSSQHSSSGSSHGHSHHGHVPAPVLMPSPHSHSAPLPPSSYTQPRMSAPRLMTSPSTNSSGQHLGSPGASAPLADPAPPVPTPVPDSVPDALSNPFGDDEVHVRRFQPIKTSSYDEPSSHQTEAASTSQRSTRRRSVSGSSQQRQRPLSDSYRSSSRRSASVR